MTRSTGGDRVAAAALRCVGVPFRAHGRDPAFGLDCVGLAAAALRGGGYAVRVPEGYALATGAIAAVAIPGELCACDGQAVGDLIVCRVSPAQLHLAIRVGDGIVHADLGARRVVMRPGVPPWPVIAAFRGEE